MSEELNHETYEIYDIKKQRSKKEIKCVVWDLDETLWEGTLLESEHIYLKPGIANIIQTLDGRGILHSIASKNHFDDAINALRKFGLDEYFLYPEINWNAKSGSLAKIQKNLNIVMDSILFIDDQAYEREEVQSVYPDILCVDAVEYHRLLSWSCLNPRFITRDSRRRREMFLEDMQRKKAEEDYQGPSAEFLTSLNMQCVISEAHEEDLQRAQELTVRTHQLNATGRMYNYDELNWLRTSANHKLFVCELTDRFGSYGKIGLALIEMTKTHWHLKLLIVSCRVMSRGIGTVLLSFIMQQAKGSGKELLADFKNTGTNQMMYVTYKFANFREYASDNEGNMILKNDLSQIQPFPPYMRVQTP